MRHAQPFPALETARLRLRAVKSDDDSFYHALLSIPKVTRFGNFPDAPSKAQSDRILNWMSRRFDAGRGCAWLIEEREAGLATRRNPHQSHGQSMALRRDRLRISSGLLGSGPDDRGSQSGCCLRARPVRA